MYAYNASESIYDSAQCMHYQLSSLLIGTYNNAYIGHLWTACEESNVCNDVQTLIWTT